MRTDNLWLVLTDADGNPVRDPSRTTFANDKTPRAHRRTGNRGDTRGLGRKTRTATRRPVLTPREAREATEKAKATRIEHQRKVLQTAARLSTLYNESYGYKNENIDDLKKRYRDGMFCLKKKRERTGLAVRVPGSVERRNKTLAKQEAAFWEEEEPRRAAWRTAKAQAIMESTAADSEL